MNSTYLLEFDLVNQYIQAINQLLGINDIPIALSYCYAYNDRHDDYFILIIKIQVPEPGQSRSLLAADHIIFGNGGTASRKMWFLASKLEHNMAMATAKFPTKMIAEKQH